MRAAGASDREEAAISELAEEAYDQGVRIAKVSALKVESFAKAGAPFARLAGRA